jgi:hypothetical protein
MDGRDCATAKLGGISDRAMGGRFRVLPEGWRGNLSEAVATGFHVSEVEIHERDEPTVFALFPYADELTG